MSAGTNRIIMPLIVVFILATTAPAFAGQIIYVDDDGPADFNNIQAAINDASDGDTIIVAEGRYFENINFNGKNITLTSTDPCNPDVVAATIIDGSQNGSVVTFNSDEDANRVLNGFTITNGHAERGGGIYCGRAPGPPPPPPPPPGTLSEQSSPEILSETNLIAPTIKNCIISNNSAGSGGGMYNNWDSSLILTNCTFNENSAGKGGGMYNIHSGPILNNCSFSNNSASNAGGGMNNFSESSPTLTNCTFNGNSAGLGGGMYNRESSPTLNNCSFSGNSAVIGGGMCNEGFWRSEINPILTNCIFSGNSADVGGGMFNYESSPTLTNCTFNGNSATNNGGGMENYNNIPTLTNCTFNGNSAGERGGGMFNGGPPYTEFKIGPKLTNCTFTGNLALGSGGGMYNYRSYDTTVINCIFWENMAGSSTGESAQIQGPPIIVNYSCIQGWTGILGGTGNMGADPCFVEPQYLGPISYWKLDEADGNTAYDSAGQNYGTVHGAQCTSGQVNSALDFDGVDDYVRTANNVFTNAQLAFGATLSAWFNTDSTAHGYIADNEGYLTLGVNHFENSNKLFGIVDDGGQYGFLSSSADVTDNLWHHAAIVWDGTDTAILYLDGINVSSGHSGPPTPDRKTRPFTIGAHSTIAAYFNGLIDEVAIYDRALSDDEIQQHYLSGLNGQDYLDANMPDFHLLPGSPCINTGDPNYIAKINERDLDGNPRVIGCRIDMGAFEYRHLVPADVRIVPRSINLANRGKWITALLWLPENYHVAEIDFCILLLEDEIQPEQLFINEKEQAMMARFNDEQLHGILNTGDLELTISAQLTDATVFEGTDVIKVIYEGGGKLAKLSGKASNPDPADGAMDVGLIDVLSWTAGSNATSHDVYFGTSNPPPFISNQTTATFDPGTMAFDTTYFWRIDEVNKWGTTTGDLWSFRPPPPPPPPPPW